MLNLWKATLLMRVMVTELRKCSFVDPRANWEVKVYGFVAIPASSQHSDLFHRRFMEIPITQLYEYMCVGNELLTKNRREVIESPTLYTQGARGHNQIPAIIGKICFDDVYFMERRTKKYFDMST